MQLIQTSTGTYQVSPQGTYYHKDTPDVVIRVLEICRADRLMVRLDYGDPQTGCSWSEEHDVYGRVSRSCGPVKVPILLAPGEDGGPAILDHCIVAIMTPYGKDLYRHPHYRPKYDWRRAEIRASDSYPGRAEILAPCTATGAQEVVARFGGPAGARQWLKKKQKFEPMPEGKR